MPKILYEKRQKIAYITINNAEKANILDRETSHEISEAWKEVWEDHDVRVAILTGVGERHFCAGHNLAPRPDITAEERERVRAESVFWPLASTVNGAKIGADGRLGDHYPQIWKPVIGAIKGWAAGAGVYLMLTSTPSRRLRRLRSCSRPRTFVLPAVPTRASNLRCSARDGLVAALARPI